MQEPLRDTGYAKELARAVDGGHRIERLFVKPSNGEDGEVEIRFSWWKNGRPMMRPLDLPERELLQLLRIALEQDVFSAGFLRDLHSMLYEHRGSGAKE